jgi:formyltetrahydrofolate synthetase
MIDPKMINGYPVKKYSDKQIEKCKEKINFIKNRLININSMDIEYRVMINDILRDYEAKLHEMEHAVEWISYNQIIY